MNETTSWLSQKLKQLNVTDTMATNEGFTRLSYTAEEAEAQQAFITISEELGLDTHQDEAGNIWAMWQAGPENNPAVATGSHLDTVFKGGGYDGTAGVLCSLGAVKILKENGFQPKKNIAVVCFASEESARFGVSTIGSKAVSGLLDKDQLERIKDNEGTTIRKAVESFGLDWSTIQQAEKQPGELESFVELHIEQGTEIEDHGAEIGIVRGVACPVRLKVTVHGMANHTGTTPMDKRKDALVAIAPFITFVNEKAKLFNESSNHKLVATVSTMNLQPNYMNVIPGEVEVGVDIRSVDDALKRELAKEIIDYCKELEISSGMEIKVETLVDNASVFLNKDVKNKLEHVVDNLGYRSIPLDSGAGHDVMNLAKRWPSGLIFIPCKEGISHHPTEYASIADLYKGTKIIADYLRMETGDENESNNWSDRTGRLS
ncbi:M20 family metallo-hydrolase [Halobacillus salinarum]|uniref:M20 family metallo-hydrolase n=1 Tax=Halobacillus salinarum TaxID=2932257 RepID=A0ABY4EGJ9_9BACI|nr:M20 family metallo-hydrolase [Halobacillus salinarum]UOQ43264.1 M20 family metallo-hydrolase [Halobacillus salinarum]